MSGHLDTTHRVDRVDKFKVPAAARGESLERVRMTHAILRAVPGFVRELLLEQSGGPGGFNPVTVVIWEDAGAIENAKAVRSSFSVVDALALCARRYRMTRRETADGFGPRPPVDPAPRPGPVRWDRRARSTA
jgi:hypothetical protein